MAAPSLAEREIELIRELVEFDPEHNAFFWRRRRPDHFYTRFPDRTAEGWNSVHAGEKIKVSPRRQVTIKTGGKRIRVYPNRLAALLGGKWVPDTASVLRKPVERRRFSGALIRSPDMLLRLFRQEADGLLTWQFRTPELMEELRLLADAAPIYRGRPKASFGEKGRRLFNSRYATRPVRSPREGERLSIGNVLFVDDEDLERMFPGFRYGASRPPVKLPFSKPEITDDDIAMLFYIGPDGVVRNRPRAGETWRRLREIWAYRLKDTSPIAQGWNAKHAGQPAPRRGDVFKIGARNVGMRRVEQVCRSKAVNPF